MEGPSEPGRTRVPVRGLGIAFARVAALVGALVGARVGAVPPLAAEEAVQVAYEFARTGDLLGWRPNAHLAEVRLDREGLHCRGQGSDPILELEPRLSLPAEPWQVVEIALRADRDGMAELFWSPTDQGPHGGFSQERSLRFPVRAGPGVRTYRLRPFWHPDRTVVRLRLDLYDAASFDLASIRVLGPTRSRGAGVDPRWDFTRGSEGWTECEGLVAKPTALGLRLIVGDEEGRVWGPPVEFEAATRPALSLRMAVDRGRRGTVFLATRERAGMQSLSFPLRADGREHDYLLDLTTLSGVRGRVIALGLQPSDQPGARARVRSLAVGSEPAGEPALEVVSQGIDRGRACAGEPVRWVARVRNAGGGAATGLVGRLHAPGGVGVRLESPSATRDVLRAGEAWDLAWIVVGDRPGNHRMRLDVEADGWDVVRAGARLELGPSPGTAGGLADLPDPKPVRGPYEVGVYYFPGWRTAGPWEPIRRFPERRPLLGWYREGDPEVADWHIRWAVEHGITFFAYDWYWSRGARQLEHALHDGYFRARHRGLLKFCLLWANHNAPGTSSHDDCLAVTRFWIANYFHRPEHLRVQGKPVVVVFSPDRLSADLGPGGVRRALDAMRAECARAGLGGLLVLACVGDAGGARQCAAEGYDAVTAYTWPHLGVPEGRKTAPYADLLPGYRQSWEHLADTAGIPLVPPVNGGWDSRPWHGDDHWVRYDRTPELFRRHLLDARDFLDARRGGEGGSAPVLPMILVEAWNEFGEGAYIEPHREHGFGYLDALRRVFGGPDGRRRHRDFVPADVGAGPYDVEVLDSSRTRWEFETGDEGWDQTMDLEQSRAADGVLSATASGNDPAWFGPPIEAEAERFGGIRLRLRLSAPEKTESRDVAQVFWRTSTRPESEATSVRFPVAVDGGWHEYEVRVGGHPGWRGTVTRLRLDPVNRTGVRMELDWLGLVPGGAPAE